MNKEAIKSLLKDLLATEKKLREANGDSGEGEILSSGLEDYADLLKQLGEYLAEATNLTEQLDSRRKFIKEEQKLYYQNEKVDGKHRSIAQAHSLAITGPKYQEAVQNWLEASKAKVYLKIRFEAAQNFIDAARSRLSHLTRTMQ